MVTRCSPEAVNRMAALGSSRTISTSLRAGRVMAPSWSTEAETRGAHRDVEIGAGEAKAVLGGLDQDVGEDRQRRLGGTLAATATRPSWSCSRVIVNFMPLLDGG